MDNENLTNANQAQPASEPNQAQQGGGGSDLASQIGPETIISVSHPYFDDMQGVAQNLNTPDQTGQTQADYQTGQTQAGTDTGPVGNDDANQSDSPADNQDPNQDQAAAKPYTTLKYRGREIPIQDENHARNLMQMGLDYNTKLHALNPHIDTLKRVMQAQGDPARAARLNAILNGDAAPAQGPGNQRWPGQEESGPAQAGRLTPGQLPMIPARDGRGQVMLDDNGQPIMADPTFVRGVLDLMDAMGISPNANHPAQPAQLPPEVQELVATKKMNDFKGYLKANYKADFDAVASDVFNFMINEMGVMPNSPQDNAQTFENAFLRMKAMGMLDGKMASASVTSDLKMPVNKSELKSQAQAASGTGQYPKQNSGFDYKAAVKKAAETGASDDWVTAVGGAISHPDLA